MRRGILNKDLVNPTKLLFCRSACTSRTMLTLRGVLLMCLAASTGIAQAQRIDSSAVPDAPSALLPAQAQGGQQTPSTQQSATGAADKQGGQGQQTKRILGVFPNFRAVSADTKLPPQTVAEKFKATAAQTFDYSDIPLIVVLAGIDEAENSTPEFHQGAAGYARYFWHNAADQIDENFWVQAILPSVLHEDSRYYTLGQGGLARRTVYAFGRTFITRSDSGKETFNFSEIIGSGAASGISAAYYPTVEQTWTKVGQRWLQNGIIDGATYVIQEFWPDINNKLFHTKDD